MKKIKILAALICLFPALGYAEIPLPPAPTLSDVETFAACSTYANNMSDWAYDQPTTNDHQNGLWFYGFGTASAINQASQSCTNNVCTSYYYVANGSGQAAGCVIAKSASVSAKASLLQILTSAYDLAVTHQIIIKTYKNNGYGLYGPSSVCTNVDNYAGCELYHK